MVWLSWTAQITYDQGILKIISSMTPLNSGPLRMIPLYLEKVDCNVSSENWRKMAILITSCTETSIPKAPNQQEFVASLKCTRIVGPSLFRHFAPSGLLLEHTIITWLNIFAIFYRRTFQLNIALLTLLLLYRTSNLYLCLVNLYFLLM